MSHPGPLGLFSKFQPSLSCMSTDEGRGASEWPVFFQSPDGQCLYCIVHVYHIYRVFKDRSVRSSKTGRNCS